MRLIVMDELTAATDRVTIAPQVLTTVVKQTALRNPGVKRLAARLPRRTRMSGQRAMAPGVEVILADGEVHAAVYVIAQPDANMMQLARALQSEIAHAIEHIVGLKVSDVNVTIDDVSFPSAVVPQ